MWVYQFALPLMSPPPLHTLTLTEGLFSRPCTISLTDSLGGTIYTLVPDVTVQQTFVTISVIHRATPTSILCTVVGRN